MGGIKNEEKMGTVKMKKERTKTVASGNYGFQMGGARCPKCGTPARVGAKFCSKCGRKLPSGVMQETENHTGTGKTSKKHFVRNVILGLLCLGIAGGGGTFAYFYMNGTGWPFHDYYQEAAQDEIVYEQGDVYVDSQILITAAENVGRSAIKKMVKSSGGKIVGHIFVSNDYQISFPEGKIYGELQELLTELNSNEAVESATLNLVFDGQTSAVDYSGDPWQVKNADESSDSIEEAVEWDEQNPGGSNWWAEVISISSVWDLDFETELSVVNVGILDSMFDATNEDLSGSFAKVYQNPEDVSVLYTETYDTYAASEDGTEKEELYSKLKKIIHGTHVAGIIGAEANSFGITGVSQNVKLYGFSLFGEEEYEYISMMEWKYGIAVLLADDVRVINISMEQGRELSVSAQYDENRGLTAETSDAISALDNLAKSMSLFLSKCLEQYDFLIVKAAGNENGYSWVVNEDYDMEHPYSVRMKTDADDDSEVIRIEYDSSYDFLSRISSESVKEHILTVGAASLQTGEETYCDESWFSARNADIYAPGMQILSDFPGNSTDYLSGTSMSASMVTGIAAIIWGIHPELTATEVKTILLQSTDYNTWGKDINIIDAMGSVTIALGTFTE